MRRDDRAAQDPAQASPQSNDLSAEGFEVFQYPSAGFGHAQHLLQGIHT